MNIQSTDEEFVDWSSETENSVVGYGLPPVVQEGEENQLS